MKISELERELQEKINYEKERLNNLKISDLDSANALVYKISFLSLQQHLLENLDEKEIVMLENKDYFNKYTVYDYINCKLFNSYDQVKYMNDSIQTLKRF